jgi:hypothetical protein
MVTIIINWLASAPTNPALKAGPRNTIQMIFHYREAPHGACLREAWAEGFTEIPSLENSLFSRPKRV